MGRLDGKVALISGGARGQGATEAQLFSREGAKVVLGDVLDEAGRQVEAAIRAAGGEATYMHLNVTSEADWIGLTAKAMAIYGRLDILVNNAGISSSSVGDPDGLEGEVCVANPDAVPGVTNPPGTPARRYVSA